MSSHPSSQPQHQPAGASGSGVGLSGSSKKLNAIAWALAAFVVIVGIVMLVITENKVFIVFIVLGILTGLNVVLYDQFVLKPKLAAERRAQAEAAREPGTPEETP